MGIKILYAGDSPVGGAANYLLGIMQSMKASVTHLPPADKLLPETLSEQYDLIIFSDYSAKQVSSKSERLILNQIDSGSGILMIGGWGSYSGPFGGWRGTAIEKRLPVYCSKGDDRTNFPGGASLCFKESGNFLEEKIFYPAPAICGMNNVKPKKHSRVLITVKRMLSNGKTVRFESKEYPLLVIDADRQKRAAALTTDLAPHWCGGMVDWGNSTLTLPVTSAIRVQVGNYYVQFVTSLLSWLARA